MDATTLTLGLAEPGSKLFPYRRPHADELINPFDKSYKSNGSYTMKYCAWEVLKDYPAGLTVKHVVDEIEARGLRVFRGKANPTGQVSGDMSRDTDHFFHYHNSNIWSLTPFVPPALLALGSSHDRRRQKRTKGEGDSRRSSEARKRKAERNDRYALHRQVQAQRARGADGEELPDKWQLVGLKCKIWWDTEGAYYAGRVADYNVGDDTYEVAYGDGERDFALRLLRYTVQGWPNKNACLVVTRSIEEETGRGLDVASDDDAEDPPLPPRGGIGGGTSSGRGAAAGSSGRSGGEGLNANSSVQVAQAALAAARSGNAVDQLTAILAFAGSGVAANGWQQQAAQVEAAPREAAPHEAAPRSAGRTVARSDLGGRQFSGGRQQFSGGRQQFSGGRLETARSNGSIKLDRAQSSWDLLRLPSSELPTPATTGAVLAASLDRLRSLGVGMDFSGAQGGAVASPPRRRGPTRPPQRDGSDRDGGGAGRQSTALMPPPPHAGMVPRSPFEGDLFTARGREGLPRVDTAEQVLAMTTSELLRMGGMDSLPLAMTFSSTLAGQAREAMNSLRSAPSFTAGLGGSKAGMLRQVGGDAAGLQGVERGAEEEAAGGVHGVKREEGSEQREEEAGSYGDEGSMEGDGRASRAYDEERGGHSRGSEGEEEYEEEYEDGAMEGSMEEEEVEEGGAAVSGSGGGEEDDGLLIDSMLQQKPSWRLPREASERLLEQGGRATPDERGGGQHRPRVMADRPPPHPRQPAPLPRRASVQR